MPVSDEYDDREHRIEWISVERAAKLLGLGRGTGYKQAHEFLETGVGLPCIKIGARILVSVAGLDALVQQATPQAPRIVNVRHGPVDRGTSRSV